MSEKDSLDTTVGQVADRITRMVLDGELRPRQKLSEVEFASKLSVSRNSLREAFRLLIRDGLLVHFSHRGVFVRSFETLELHDLFEFRAFIEGAAIAKFRPDDALSEYAVRQMHTTADMAREAMEKEDWAQVARCNKEFHLAVFTLAGNQRAMQLGKDILVQVHLAFMDTQQPEKLHGPFVERNKAIADALAAGDVPGAQDLMQKYLDDSRDQLITLLANRRADFLDM